MAIRVRFAFPRFIQRYDSEFGEVGGICERRIMWKAMARRTGWAAGNDWNILVEIQSCPGALEAFMWFKARVTSVFEISQGGGAL